jgi:SPFH domain / Band 7 family
LFGLLFLADYSKRRSKHTVTEYQRGAFFRKGMFVREVGAGAHKVFLGRDYIVYGDVRPISLNFERQTVGLRDGSFAQYSFFATAEVRSFRDALLSARNYAEMPYYIARREMRAAIFALNSRTVNISRQSIASALQERIRQHLESAGFALTDFRLMELHLNDSGSDPEEHGFRPEVVN